MADTNRNKRIVKNTIALYFRMILIMLVTLFTARIVLNSLGVEDYGIYNVVGGVVLMLSFLNTAMAISTQRFLNFEMGKKNFDRLRKVFSMSLNIHIIIGVVIFILLEIFGIWFLETKLNIPASRLEAAKIAFHFSCLSLFFTIITVPYYAAIIANEKMEIYAYIGIIEVILKLVVAYLIMIIDADKLILYAILLFVVTVLTRLIYLLYSLLKFKESHYFFFWEKKMFVSIFSFASWTIFGSLATLMKNQGVNIVLNIFFGPVVNAARAVSSQVDNALSSFVTNFHAAIKPQIIKSYAAEDTSYLLKLIFSGAKYSYFLLLCLSLPVLLETEQILKLWLKIVPDFSVIFVKLTIITALVDTLSVTLMSSIQATGKIKLYQIIIGILMLAILPFSYLFFKFGYPPETSYVIALIIFVFIVLARIFIVKRQINFSGFDYFKNVIWKALIVTVISTLPALFIIYFYDASISRLFTTLFVSFFSVLITIYFLGIDKEERMKLKELVYKHTKNKFFSK